MNLIDHGRVQRALLTYDWWLDLRGVRRRRRRELRSELRSNLHDAAARHGSHQAVSRLGDLRVMAAEASPIDRTRPRWHVGLSVGGAALLATLLVELLAALAWVDGAQAGAGDGPVSGSMTLFPGSSLTYAATGPGVELSITPGWLCLLVAAVAFVVASRAWRTLRTGRGEHAPVAS